LRVIRIDPADPEAALAEAVSVLRAGGLVAYPTESYYAIGADALNPDAVAKVFAAKGRAYDKPLPVILHDKTLISRFTKELSPLAVKAVEWLMPGPITLIFHAADNLPKNLTCGTGKVGIRVPEHEIMSGLARLMGGPVTATSANISGLPGLSAPDAVADALGGKIDLILDGGITPGPPPSTLLDLTAEPPRLLREGRVPKSAIEAALGYIQTLISGI